MSREAMQQALEALVTCCAEEWRTLNNFGMKQVYDEKKVNAAIAALHAALAKPQTTHWEGCEAVHPECRKPEPVVQLEFAGTLPISRGGYAPTPRKPLTEEEMRECAQSMNAEPLAEGWPELIKFARAIERAHGIGEQHD